MSERETPANSYHARLRTSTIRLFGWTAAWVAATALMKFGPRLLWNQALVFTLLAVVLLALLAMAKAVTVNFNPFLYFRF